MYWNQISKLGISLEDLYAEKKQLRVKCDLPTPITFSVLLIGRDGEPDCKISSWGANLYFRSRNGQNRKKYVSLRTLENSISTYLYKYVGATVYDTTYSLSDEIDII